MLESNLIVNVKQLAFGDAENKFLATNSTNFHKLGHERTPFVKRLQMQVCALRCQAFTFDFGKIFLEQDL